MKNVQTRLNAGNRLRFTVAVSLSALCFQVTAADLKPSAAERAAKVRTELEAKDIAIRQGAIKSLVHSDLSEGLNAEIQRSLKDEDGMVRSTAATAVGNLGSHAVTAVEQLVIQVKTDAMKEARETAARALGRIGKAAPDAKGKIVPALELVAEKDADAVTRVVALGALSMLEVAPKEQIVLIRKYLHHDDALVRMKAAHALGMLGFLAKEAAPEIVEVLKRETDDHRRGYVARALGNTGDPASLPALEEALKRETDVGAQGEMRGAIKKLAALSLTLSVQQDWPPVSDASKDTILDARLVQTFESGVKPEWGYAAAQKDTFILIHPKQARKNAPLYVVLHSAGHDVFSCVNCTRTVGNHDIYRSPDDHYALYLDCGKNRGNDWWWGGMHLKDPKLTQKNGGGAITPVEKRVIDTVKWVIQKYGIDPNRVYLSGNSMGGSGTLGIGVRHGDVFAAIKANVPAGIEHVSQRMYFAPSSVPAGVQLPDPPVVVDYSAPNDSWSAGHERFVKAMEERKYALYFYWGPFGHANNSAQIMKVNDLIDSFDWLSVRKNEPYIVFTNASCNSPLPWPDDLKNAAAGQVNAFFRWKNIADSAEKFEAALSLADAAQVQTKFEIPKEAGVDITLRRVQHFKLAPGTKFQWSFGEAKGEGTSDAEGLVSIPALKLTQAAKVLRVSK